MPRKPAHSVSISPLVSTLSGGRLVNISGKGEPTRLIDPAQVAAIDEDGSCCTIHLSGGTTINVSRNAASLRDLLGL